MEVLMGVDPGDDTPVVVCDGGPATLPLLVLGWRWVARTAGRVDKTGSRPGRSGASSVTIHPTGCATRQARLAQSTGQIKDTRRVEPL
jgi:hypothetical protein